MGKLRILLFASVFLLSVVAGCWAQTQFPDTPAARQCAAWLATFNADARDNYRDFLQKNFPSSRYGYGFADQTINGTRCFGHGGGAPRINGELEICPGPGYVIAVLSNLDPPAATRISEFIANRLPER